MTAATTKKIAERSVDLKPLDIDWLVIMRTITEAVQQNPPLFETDFTSVNEPIERVLTDLKDHGYTTEVSKTDDGYKLKIRW